MVKKHNAFFIFAYLCCVIYLLYTTNVIYISIWDLPLFWEIFSTDYELLFAGYLQLTVWVNGKIKVSRFDVFRRAYKYKYGGNFDETDN